MAATRSKKSSATTRRRSSSTGRGAAGRTGGKRGSSSTSSSSRGKSTRTANTGKITTDHQQIRRWVERRGGKPACVLGTGGGGDEGVLRIDFPGYSGQASLQHISWDDWFEKFDDANLALLYQDRTSGGQRSNFNKLVDRSQGSRRGAGKTKARSKSTGRHGRSA